MSSGVYAQGLAAAVEEIDVPIWAIAALEIVDAMLAKVKLADVVEIGGDYSL